MLLKADTRERPGTMNEIQALLALILAFLQESRRDYIHVALVLFREEGSMAEVEICHEKPLRSRIYS